MTSTAPAMDDDWADDTLVPNQNAPIRGGIPAGYEDDDGSSDYDDEFYDRTQPIREPLAVRAPGPLVS
jgi:hypothetical protein